MGCFRGAPLGVGYPCPDLKKMGYYLDAECPEVELVPPEPFQLPFRLAFRQALVPPAFLRPLPWARLAFQPVLPPSASRQAFPSSGMLRAALPLPAVRLWRSHL